MSGAGRSGSASGSRRTVVSKHVAQIQAAALRQVIGGRLHSRLMNAAYLRICRDFVKLGAVA
jgi:hypothetical protein